MLSFGAVGYDSGTGNNVGTALPLPEQAMHVEKLVSVQVVPKTLCCSDLRSFGLLSSGQVMYQGKVAKQCRFG